MIFGPILVYPLTLKCQQKGMMRHGMAGPNTLFQSLHIVSSRIPEHGRVVHGTCGGNCLPSLPPISTIYDTHLNRLIDRIKQQLEDAA